MEETYSITRTFMRSDLESQLIETGLTLEEAQEHCRDPETSSSTAEEDEGVERTLECGPWFDGYNQE